MREFLTFESSLKDNPLLEANMTSSEVAIRFVQRINAHDKEGLVALMTPSHIFIDSLGYSTRRPEIEDGWRQYFEMVPDYWVRIDRAFSQGDTSVLVGEAGGTYTPKGGAMKRENKWKTPAVWTAKIEGEEVVEWRIYSDNEPIREKMRASRTS
jgi:ketosteroid isomerase-like protein